MSRADEKLAELLAKVTDQDEEDYELEDDDLPFLFRGLHSLAPKWHGFCLQLGVKGLDQIEINGTSVDDCLVLALQDWLKTPDVSWRKLIEAIFRPAGGGHQVLASDVAQSFRVMCTFKPIEQARTTSTTSIMERYSGDIDSAVMHIVNMLEGKVAPRWYQMGVSLGTPVADLEGIRLSRKPAKESERMMFQALLQSENKHLPRTWQLLVDSVGHKAGGNNQRLAKSLSKKISGSDGASPGKPESRNGAIDKQKPVTDSVMEKKPKLIPAKISRGSKPSLPVLMHFPQGNDHIDLTTQIGASYRKLAIFLLDDAKGAIISGLETQHLKDATDINTAVFTKWMEGTNRVAVTWDWLVESLRKANLHELADTVESGLGD